MTFKSFIKECNNKDVFKKLSIYIVSSWVLLQVFAVIWEPLGLPKKSVTYLIVLLLIGFPVNVYLVWKYHLVNLVYKRKRLDEEGNIVKRGFKDSPFQKMYFTSLGLISIFSVLSVTLIVNNKFNTNIVAYDLTIVEASDKIAVLRFGNNTGDSKYDIVSKMAADWIIHGITENNLGQVISPEIVDNYIKQINASEYVSTLNNEKIIQEYFNAGKIISGNFYLKNEKLLFQGTVTDGTNKTQLISFKLVDCDSDLPLDCIEKLNQLILGFLITDDNEKINLQKGLPPKFEAFQYLIDAKVSIEDSEEYLYLLNRAIDTDPSFFEPKVLRVALYYNERNYKIADSLWKTIVPTSSSNTRQRNLLNVYRNLLDGTNDKIFSTLKKEYDIFPFDIETNTSFMGVALQYVNKPEEVEAIFNEISTKDMDVESCKYCKYRFYTKALADIELGNYRSAIESLKQVAEKVDDNLLYEPLFSALIRSDNSLVFDAIIKKLELTKEIEDLEGLYLHIGKENLRLDRITEANFYFDKIINTDKLKEIRINKTRASFYKGNYKLTEIEALELLEQDASNSIELTSILATSQIKNGKKEVALETIEHLKSLKSDFQYGAVDYALGQFYATIDNDEKVYEHLLKAVAQGSFYTPETFQNDPIFKKYYSNSRFKEILTFWH